VDAALNAMSNTRREILLHIKKNCGATISEIARHLQISDEGARQHLIRLERQGWVARRVPSTDGGHSGRPASRYEVSQRGEDLFPKRYHELSIALIDGVLDLYGPDALKTALGRVADTWVRAWDAKLRGRTLDERLEMLRDYYTPGDPFLSIEGNGHVSLVERNCPFRDVAMARPHLCSITVNVLTRLLGYRVERVRKLQAGDGCCEFRVLTDRPVRAGDTAFALEPRGDDAGG
jgi:predicted ArsR family transcriptional regulator